MSLQCPECRRTNPGQAAYCYYDGYLLKGQKGKDQRNRLAKEFRFPSGRKCRTFDELAEGCQVEWKQACDLLKNGSFNKFFESIGRVDLAVASEEAQAEADLDIGLTNFLDALPVTRKRLPKLDLSPRRIHLGKMQAGNSRKVYVKVQNQGKGTLQGNLSVGTEDSEWVRVGDGSGNGKFPIKTSGEQKIPVVIDTKGLSAAKGYTAKLRVITNGGVVEIPVGMDITAMPFPRKPFQGARNPREMAQRMKKNPKAAAIFLENGELSRWFSINGWKYPVPGTPATGVAGVQQFFEAMGLVKPPKLKISQSAVKLVCFVPDKPRVKISISAPEKKYVYANVSADVQWLNILTPTISGARQTSFLVEIDPHYLPRQSVADGTISVRANGGQKFKVKVRVDIHRPGASFPGNLLRPMVAMALFFLVFRLLSAPLADFFARTIALESALSRAVTSEYAPELPNIAPGAWLKLPWKEILLSELDRFPPELVGEQYARAVNMENFRDFFVSQFVRIITVLMGWLGAVVGCIYLFYRHGWANALWGFISGLVLGILVTATLGCLLLVVDLIPLTVWSHVFSGQGNMNLLPLWIGLAVLSWTLMGAVLGFVLALKGQIGKTLLEPVQEGMSGLFRFCGIRGLANFCDAQ